VADATQESAPLILAEPENRAAALTVTVLGLIEGLSALYRLIG